jgi:hypothetical protein
LLTDFPLTDFPLTDVPLTDIPGAVRSAICKGDAITTTTGASTTIWNRLK